MTAFEGWTGSLHRGLGLVARWPGVAMVIPDDPTQALAVTELLRDLGPGPTADQVRQAVAAHALRGTLRAVAYVAEDPDSPGNLMGFACGATEVIGDGQVAVNGTGPLQEKPVAGDQRVTVRAANLASAARPVALLDLRLGVAPGAGITLSAQGNPVTDLEAPGAGAEAATPSRPATPAGPGGILSGGSAQRSELPARPDVPPPSPVPIPVGVRGFDEGPAVHPPTGAMSPPVPLAEPFQSVLLGSAPATPPQPLAPLPTVRPLEPGAPVPVQPGPLGQPVPAHRAPAPALPVGDDDVVVEGILCARHHFNNPAASYCMVCGISMVHLTHNLVPGPRPTLGYVVFDNGSTYGLDRSYVVGREPGTTTQPNTAPLAVHDDNETLSRRHAEIRLVDWEVHVVDLGSTNGTFVWDTAFERWNQLPPHQPVLLSPGDTVALGRRTFVFESVTRL